MPSLLPPPAPGQQARPFPPPPCLLSPRLVLHRGHFLAHDLTASSQVLRQSPRGSLPPSCAFLQLAFQMVARELFLGKPVQAWNSPALNAHLLPVPHREAALTGPCSLFPPCLWLFPSSQPTPLGAPVHFLPLTFARALPLQRHILLATASLFLV